MNEFWFAIKNRKRRQNRISLDRSFLWEGEKLAQRKNLLLFVFWMIYSRRKERWSRHYDLVALFSRCFCNLSHHPLIPLSHLFLSGIALLWLCSRVIRIIMIKLVVDFFYSLIFFTLRRRAKLHLLPFMRRKSRKSPWLLLFLLWREREKDISFFPRFLSCRLWEVRNLEI